MRVFSIPSTLAALLTEPTAATNSANWFGVFMPTSLHVAQCVATSETLQCCNPGLQICNAECVASGETMAQDSAINTARRKT